MIRALIELRRWLRKHFIELDFEEVEIVIRFSDPSMKDRVRDQIVSEIDIRLDHELSRPVSEISKLMGFKLRIE